MRLNLRIHRPGGGLCRWPVAANSQADYAGRNLPMAATLSDESLRR